MRNMEINTISKQAFKILNFFSYYPRHENCIVISQSYAVYRIWQVDGKWKLTEVLERITYTEIRKIYSVKSSIGVKIMQRLPAMIHSHETWIDSLIPIIPSQRVSFAPIDGYFLDSIITCILQYYSVKYLYIPHKHNLLDIVVVVKMSTIGSSLVVRLLSLLLVVAWFSDEAGWGSAECSEECSEECSGEAGWCSAEPGGRFSAMHFHFRTSESCPSPSCLISWRVLLWLKHNPSLLSLVKVWWEDIPLITNTQSFIVHTILEQCPA